jgi:DNA-binding NarL/FixJ family response regulator
MTTIVLADKSNIIRYGLRSLLDVHADFRIIGEAAGGWETIQLIGRLKPNILILDWGLARRGRMEVLRRAQQSSPSTQIILFSLDWDESQFLDADESRDVELVYCDSIGDEVVRRIHEGPVKPPCLIALTPLCSIPRRRNRQSSPAVASA